MAPVITALAPDSLAALSGFISVGHSLLAVNGERVVQHQAATDKLRSALGDIELTIGMATSATLHAGRAVSADRPADAKVAPSGKGGKGSKGSKGSAKGPGGSKGPDTVKQSDSITGVDGAVGSDGTKDTDSSKGGRGGGSADGDKGGKGALAGRGKGARQAMLDHLGVDAAIEEMNHVDTDLREELKREANVARLCSICIVPTHCLP